MPITLSSSTRAATRAVSSGPSAFSASRAPMAAGTAEDAAAARANGRVVGLQQVVAHLVAQLAQVLRRALLQRGQPLGVGAEAAGELLHLGA